MKTIINKLDEAQKLLFDCGWNEKSTWLEEKSKILSNCPKEEIIGHLTEIKSILVGIGSFSDIPLSPPKGSSMSSHYIRNKQWDLANELGILIDEYIKNHFNSKNANKRA